MVAQTLVKTLVRRSLASGLRGVWLKGQLPGGPLVLAANHHSWWDGYVGAGLIWHHGRQMSVMMSQHRLAEFPLFRSIGAFPNSSPRQGLKDLQAGKVLLLFPEGEVGPATQVQNLQAGAVWYAKVSKVPLIPMALRVWVRGQEAPEAYAWLGQPTEANPQALQEALNSLLSQLEALNSSHPAEEALPGFTLAMVGKRSTHERMAPWSNALKRLTRRS